LTIDVLPDDVLLYMFYLYQEETNNLKDGTWPWHVLVHVCSRWRHVIFASPRHLDLKLLCTSRTPARKSLDIWPPLPIVIRSYFHFFEDGDNVIAALEQHDRVCSIDLSDLTSSQLERLTAAMQKPFPVLKFLGLQLNDEIAPVLPFPPLNGSAPRLRTLLLSGIPLSNVPTLLLSATDLVDLRLLNIPFTGYISPEELAAWLSALTRLGSLSIKFKCPSTWDIQASPRSPPLTRTILPALSQLQFKGISTYFEDLVSRIDAPLLDDADITFFYDAVFDTPQLPLFLHRAEKLIPFNRADVIFRPHSAEITLRSSAPLPKITLRTSCSRLNWQVSSMAQICIQCSSLLSRAERLDLCQDSFLLSEWQVTAPWVTLFHTLRTVRTVYVSGRLLVPLVARVLGELTEERATEVLPVLDTLVLGVSRPVRPLQSIIRPFFTTRQRSNHPVTVQCGQPWSTSFPMF
jgi:hypothetical protein